MFWGGAAMKIFCTECGAELEPDAQSCPHCGTHVEMPRQNELGKSPRKGMSLVLKIAMGILIICILCVGGLILANRSSLLSPSAEMQVKATDMMEDYMHDQDAAEQKYKGKKIIIHGKVAEKIQFNNSTDYGILLASKDANGHKYGIIVGVDAKDISMINQVKTGDFISAQGICEGIVKQDDPKVILVQVYAKKIKN